MIRILPRLCFYYREDRTIKKASATPSPRRQKQNAANAVLFCGLLFCIGCCWLGFQVAGPLEQSARVRAENDALERQLHRTIIQNQTLTKQIQAMDTEQGIIVAARQKGYMMPYERPLHIQK